MIQDFLTSLGVFFRILDRIELCRVLCDTCQSYTLRKVQIPDILIKILPCRCLYTISSCSKVNGIQIVLKDHILIIDLLLNFYGKILLLYFTGKTLKPGRLLGPVGKYVVLEKLLSDRTCSLRKIS